MRHKALLAILVALLLGFAASANDASNAARGQVELLYASLSELVQADPPLDLADRVALLEPAVTQSYDLPFMSAKVLGRHWKKLGESERLQWIDVFSRLTVQTYADRFEETGGGEQFEVLDVAEGGRDTLIVRTRVVPTDDDPVPIDYRLHHRGGTWRIVDVYLNGTVSELALRRSEYSGVVKRDGIESLIAKLEAKIETEPAPAASAAAAQAP